MDESEPYDEILDIFMRANGWQSRRKAIEDGDTDADFFFDEWTRGDHRTRFSIQAIGGGQFELRTPHWRNGTGSIAHDKWERMTLPDRASVMRYVTTGRP
ncbi:hypothetical protein [Leifsonia sp. C5G2]|uniref:hypothetical protein n=1 Tax=Leifsonia sp. C5G2 TaxID=2735269 RepID=UPI00158585AA|nr:hypothetical protein [Leifsonia sp. C5G2]NUU08422.1 hypothetical protein [Leifsonia sp. C5G2]